MNKRLVWNFEISSDNLLIFNNLKDIREELRWEARFFWPEDAIIYLNGLDNHFLALSNYEIKHREDQYFLLTDHDFNIKQRRNQLFYKPHLQKKDLLIGYGKKINLAESPPDLILAGSNNLRVTDLLEKLDKNQQIISVSKEALIYKFPSTPTIKLELARLEISKCVYFSLCVEGRSQALVTTLARGLLGTKVSCDYVSFLKQIKSC